MTAAAPETQTFVSSGTSFSAVVQGLGLRDFILVSGEPTLWSTASHGTAAFRRVHASRV